MNLINKVLVVIIAFLFVGEVLFVNGFGSFLSAEQEICQDDSEASEETNKEAERIDFQDNYFLFITILPCVLETETLQYIHNASIYTHPFIEISSPPPNFFC